MCLSPLINSVCRWRSHQHISKWCGILLQLLLLCKAPTRFLKGTFVRVRSIHELLTWGEQSFTSTGIRPTLRGIAKR
ncbi:hypothetical protein CWM66_17780 [Kosakonia sp. H7A]|nr:hypothetical protein AW40_15915 [Kosakonia radicincitans UMEnt01/12]NCF05772.1 hypothetical protein [Kosakonia sp. MH5]PTA89683.1 hypothetical protein CWM66_17780 [Kosakonia sp. H7A]QJT82739.1 hypothetical protein C0557_22965 [Kosakonia sp. MUSA4]